MGALRVVAQTRSHRRGPLNAIVLAVATAVVWATVHFLERRSQPAKEP